jgi:RNA polymerase sigma-70 factor (ECF subfamily)
MTRPTTRRVTELVRRLGDGDPAIADELLPLVYDELRGIAAALFARQRQGHTLQPTAVVHEAWLKLAGRRQGWDGRSHFFVVAARAMRQVLTDSARARGTDRRGRGWNRLTFQDQLHSEPQDYDLLDLDAALQRLAQANERHARVVELRLFAGLTVDEVADALGVTPRTIKLDWRAARAWLRHALDGSKAS